MTAAVVIEDWRPLERNTLRGFVRARLPSGMILHDVAIHVREGKAWVSPAGRPAVGKDGMQLRDKAGKPMFNPVVAFSDKATADKFSATVIEALRAAHPEAFS